MFGDPYRNRTDVNGVRGRCLNRLTNGPEFSFLIIPAFSGPVKGKRGIFPARREKIPRFGSFFPGRGRLAGPQGLPLAHIPAQQLVGRGGGGHGQQHAADAPDAAAHRHGGEHPQAGQADGGTLMLHIMELQCL